MPTWEDIRERLCHICTPISPIIKDDGMLKEQINCLGAVGADGANEMLAEIWGRLHMSIFPKNVNKKRGQRKHLKNGKKYGILTEKGGKQPMAHVKGIQKLFGIWTDVLGFLKREQLTRTVSWTSRSFHALCEPRLHGNKIKVHEVQNLILARKDTEPPMALMQIDRHRYRKVPIPNCPPPLYICGFNKIEISYLDQQVLDFIKCIAPCIEARAVMIKFKEPIWNLDEGQRVLVDRLFAIFREFPKNQFYSSLANMQYLKDIDHKMQTLSLYTINESDIPILMKFLESPRLDGKQRVVYVHNRADENLAGKILDSIKKEFHASTRPLPQPFYIRLFARNLTFPTSEEKNQQTNEQLKIMFEEDEDRDRNYYFYDGIFNFHIYRHPVCQYEQWAEDGKTRFGTLDARFGTLDVGTVIEVNNLEFGNAFRGQIIEEKEGPVEKRAKIIKEKEKRNIYLTDDVWKDVFDFIKRIELARTVCLTNRQIYDFCEPRLHGNKVVAHKVGKITIAARDTWPLTALMLKDHKVVPFPSCPPPDYISGFSGIDINFFDHQVLEFLKITSSRIVSSPIRITLISDTMKKKQWLSVDQVLNIYRELSAEIFFVSGALSRLQKIDNKVQKFELLFNNIPILMKLLASVRPDGQQRVLEVHINENNFAEEIVDAIIKEFRSSTKPVPQPFYLRLFVYLEAFYIPRIEMQNPQIDEQLTIMLDEIDFAFLCNISRHPIGQHEKWAEDGKKRLEWSEEDEATINIDLCK